ncbi:MAG: protein kinase [Eubacterium sp.]|nr:protein kinase [Eubacterium sp.]
MTDVQNVIIEYIDSSYQFVRWLDDKHSVQLVKSKIDGCEYVCKLKQHYNLEIYENLKRLSLDCVPQIYELIETKYGLIIFEEYIQGSSLEDISLGSNQKSVIEERICEIGRKICDNLKSIHSINPPIIHRDIKPQNIIISGENIYLIDFDIAKNYTGDKSRDTFLMGTKDFAAPEQFGFSESDVRTDIYGLGATLKYLALKERLDSPKLNTIIKKATQIDAKKRYQNVEEMKKALEARSGYNIRMQIKKYLPPGFRRGNVFFMLIAAIFYLVWGFICTTFKMDPNPYTGIYYEIYKWLGRIYMTVISLFIVGFSFNYLGVQDKLLEIFKLNRMKKFLKILAVIIIDVLFVIFTFLFYIIVVALILGKQI